VRSLGRFLVDRGGWLALATLVLYAWIAPPHIVTGDGAEFSTLGTTGGIAHPSGYPAYLMWLRAWSWLPVSPAHSAALATAVLGALVVLVLHAACRAWGARPVAASLAVALFASGPVVLRVSTSAEVFAPNNLVAALVLWLAADKAPLRGPRRLAALGLVAGVGLGNHLTCVLVAPIGIYGAIRGVREAPRAALAIAAGVGALVLGLATYAYALVTPDTWASWGKVHDFSELAHHFLREDYGGATAFSEAGVAIPFSDNVVALAVMLGRNYLWVFAIAAIVALAHAIARPAAETRTAWIVFGASWLLAGPVLASRFDIHLDGPNLYIVQRFHLLPALLLAVPLAVGFDRIADKLPVRSERAWLQALLPVVALLAITSQRLSELSRVQTPALEQGLRNTLGSLPPNAIVFSANNDAHFGIGYLQGALEMRRDVVWITTQQLWLAQYRARISKRSGIAIDAMDRSRSINVPFAERALASGRAVFIDQYQEAIAKTFPIYPYGILFRVLPKGTPLPSIDELFALNKKLFEGFAFGYPTPGPHDDEATMMHVLYTRPWHIIADALSKQGRREDYEYAMKMALALAPGD